MHSPDPTFPPLLTGHDVSGGTRPLQAACEAAGTGRMGAGDVVWSRNEQRVGLALILEPEVPLARSVEMLPLAMVAAGDCLGALTPPQVAVMFRWPNVILINGGVAGGVHGAFGGAANVGQVPDWLVIAIELRHRRGPQDGEPGDTPDVTWLSEEGCAELTRTDLIESYSRHLLTWINSWQDEGFRPVHESWMFRAEGREEDTAIGEGGTFVGLDDSGNLLYRTAGGEMRSSCLVDHFVAWKAPGTES